MAAMKRVPLSGLRNAVKGWALVDDDDYEIVKDLSWQLMTSTSRTGRTVSYAMATIRRDGQARRSLMHRMILGLTPKDPDVDHVDHDGLNNQRHNMRLVTHAQNHQNRPSCRGSASRYRGVSYKKDSNGWVVRVTVDGCVHSFGTFDSEADAGRVATYWRTQLMPFCTDTSPDTLETLPKRRPWGGKGEKNGNSRLTAEKVGQIRAAYDGQRGTKARLSRMFNVSKVTIGLIVSGRAWNSVPVVAQ